MCRSISTSGEGETRIHASLMSCFDPFVQVDKVKVEYLHLQCPVSIH